MRPAPTSATPAAPDSGESSWRAGAVRRARSLVCFWDGDALVVHNYLTNAQTTVSPSVLELLRGLTEYTPARAAVDSVGGAESIVSDLISQNVLVVEGSRLAERDAALDAHWQWRHDARMLHFGTQQLKFEYDAEAEEQRLRSLVRDEPPPSPFKNYRDHGLPLEQALDRAFGADLSDTLARRRTQRAFAREPITFGELSAVLQWTWGSTRQLESPLLGRYVLKTSPSGGARHSIEVYPVVVRVEDVPPGIYHYSVERHDLELLEAGDHERLLVELCGRQGWVENAAVTFFMTAVVGRSMWKYRSSHAYRVLHLDAGHLGQTFHLVCTALGLAPFTTTATDNAGIESALGLDGVSELALYTAVTGYTA